MIFFFVFILGSLVQANCIYNGITYSCGAIVPNGNVAMECCGDAWKQCFWGDQGWRCPPCCLDEDKEEPQSASEVQIGKTNKTDSLHVSNGQLHLKYVRLSQFDIATNKYVIAKVVHTTMLSIGDLILWHKDDLKQIVLSRSAVIMVELYPILDSQACCDYARSYIYIVTDQT